MEPELLALLSSEEFLSAANPYLLQAEIAAALLLGIGIVYESDKYPKSVHEWAFWFVVLGVCLETVFSVFLFVSEWHIASLQRSKIISLETGLASAETGLKIAQMNLSDRVISEDAVGPFGPMGSDLGGHVGQRLHIMIVEHDDEAERFSDSIRDVLLDVYGWNVTISPLEERPSIWNPNFPRSSSARIGRLPPGIFGPFGGNDSDIMLRSARASLYESLLASRFCIYSMGFRDISDPSPSVITLVISRKDRHALDCE